MVKVCFVLILLKNLLTFLIIVKLNELIKLVLNEFPKSKHFSIDLPHVVGSRALFKMTHQVFEFVIVGIFLERSDWDSIVELRPKRVDCVVYNYYVL